MDKGDQQFQDKSNRVINDNNLPHEEETDYYAPDSFDSYLNMKIGIPRKTYDELRYEDLKKEGSRC